MNDAADAIRDALSPVAQGINEALFAIDGVDGLEVRRFSVHEKLGAPTEIEVVVASHDESLELDGLAARPASLTLRAPVPVLPPLKKVVERRYTGVVIESARIRREKKGLSSYTFSVRSDVALLGYRKTSRVFQHQTELEIVEALLGEWDIPFRTDVDRSQLAKRKYKIQRDETDYDFVHRLIEESGITYCFEGGEGRSILVLSDAFHARPERTPALTYLPELGGLHTGADHATATHEFQEASATKYTLRDSDHRRDAKTPQEETAALETDGPLARAERYQFRPGAFLFETERSGDVTPVADQRQTSRTHPLQARRLVQRRLEAQRANAKRWSLGSNAFDLQPSTVFRVLDDPLLEGKRLMVVSTDIAAGLLDAWHVSVVAVPAAPFRSALATQRPTAHGLEPATVVGPDGEEIYVDEFGRVKVQFHWDREGRHDDASSCWVPVSSGWAGTSYGAIMTPRIGHEVLVEFLGGDPDRPIVTGRVFSHLHPTPYKLPDDKSVTVIAKTSSLGGSGGYNEIKADDRAGAERLSVQAERDLTTLVKHDRTTRIGNVDTLIVAGREERSFTSPKPNAPRTVQTNSNGLNKMEVGDSSVTVTPDGVSVKGTKITLDTGAGASITLEGDKITISAAEITTAAAKQDVTAKNLKVMAEAEVDIEGGKVFINRAGAQPAGRWGDKAPDVIEDGASTVFIGGPSVQQMLAKYVADAKAMYDSAEEALLRWNEDDKARFAEMLGEPTEEARQEILARIRRARDDLKNLTFHPAEGDMRYDPNLDGYVRPDDNDGKVRIGMNNLQNGFRPGSGGTIVHEQGHFHRIAGTIDDVTPTENGYDKEVMRHWAKTDPARARKNSGNWAWWMIDNHTPGTW